MLSIKYRRSCCVRLVLVLMAVSDGFGICFGEPVTLHACISLVAAVSRLIYDVWEIIDKHVLVDNRDKSIKRDEMLSVTQNSPLAAQGQSTYKDPQLEREKVVEDLHKEDDALVVSIPANFPKHHQSNR